MHKFYYEDFKVGETIELGRHTITQDEIIDFARKYDPQPFTPIRRPQKIQFMAA